MFPFENIVIIDKRQKIPIYQQISLAIINAIQGGTLKAGTELPGSRELAKILGVHRKTVIAAYDELNSQDWINIVPKKKPYVSTQIPLLKFHKKNVLSEEAPYSNNFSLDFKILEENNYDSKTTDHHQLIIDDGHPDVRLSPIDELLKTYRSYTSKKHAIRNAHNGTDQGTDNLRVALTKLLAETRGLNISKENILITHGAQMSIYLASILLLNKNTNIIIGRPNYPVATKAFKQANSNIIEVNVDENGMNIEEIESLCQKNRITAVYIIPHHHYPTTVTLSVERRMKLLELSKQFSFTIIEDDYDYDYHYNSSPYLPLASDKHYGNILYIGSFSKMLDPSLRIGFMVAPKNFIDQCVALRRIIDVGGDGYMQNSLAALIENGEIRRHLKKARKIYHQRRDLLDRLLQQYLSEYISYILPSGGMAIWIKLLPDFSVTKLNGTARLKIRRIDMKQNAFRFGFASMDEKELELAVLSIYKVISGFTVAT